MKRSYSVWLFSILFAMLPVATMAQQKVEIGDQQKHKLSLTTRMFINELNDGGFDPVKQAERQRARIAAPGKRNVQTLETPRLSKNEGRMYAAPDTINGRAYVSAFITLDDNNNVSALETLGVKVQCKFKNGIITSEIPVDKLAEVIDLDNVKDISVARVMKPSTDIVRKRTNVDDILAQSANALRAGIDNKYDGKGVLLGIIDKGIDFQHIAFKDKNGKSRIVKAYIYDGENEYNYDSSNITSANTDNTEEDHGTHTASIAGGSSVVVDGSVTVTDNHANATYGGIAPGATLFLCGLNTLKETYVANSFQKICKYADDNNMPVVISNSYGSHYGPHDGTMWNNRNGESLEYASEIKDYFSDNNPNHICLFATGNEAHMSRRGEGGGNHLYGRTSFESPLGTIIRSLDGSTYSGFITNIYARNTNISALGVNIYVLDAVTGAILTSTTVTQNSEVDGLEEYFRGKLYVLFDYFYSDSNKKEVLLYSPDENPLILLNNEEHPNGCTLAIEVYPLSGNTDVDLFGGDNFYFTGHLNTPNHTWVAGSDDMSVSDQATLPEVISVGAYVSRVVGKDYKDNTHSLVNKYYVDDIAPFSSYATAAQSPTDEFHPWITAPGTCVISAVNSRHRSGYYLGNYSYNANQECYRVNNNIINPYGTLSGTSMACPVVAGIVALWLQAAKEVGMNLTSSDVKRIMAETAIKDDYVTGPNASHFGNGKIDALAGLAKILKEGRKTMIKTEPKELKFDGPLNERQSQTLHVKGLYFTGTITATLTDESGTFSIDKTSIAASNEGTDITVSWEPTSAGTTTATLTLSAEGVDDATVNLTGHSDVAGLTTSTSHMVFTTRAGGTISQALTIQGRYLTGGISLSISGDHEFTVSSSTISQSNSNEPAQVTITFSPSSEGSYSAILSLNSHGTETTKVILRGSCTDGTTQLTRFEYWFDDDIGNNQPVTISGYEKTINTSINTDGLNEGMHTLYYRFAQSGGEVIWEGDITDVETGEVTHERVYYTDLDYSPIYSSQFFKHNTSMGSKVEYWFDDNSHATTTISCEADEEVTLDLTDNTKFPLGFHQLNMRFSTPGKSPSAIYTANVMKFTSDSRYLQYWVDGNYSPESPKVEGTISENGGIVFNQVKLPMTNVSPGLHHLYFRTCNSQGVAGSAVYSAVIFRHASEANQIEYWVDDDLTTLQRKEFGESSQNGSSYTLDLSGEAFPLGLHQLNIRVSTKNGSKSAVYSIPIVKKTAAKYIEYWVDNEFKDDLQRFPGTWSDDGSLVFSEVQLPMADVSPGLHHLYYRTTDAEGRPCSAVYSDIIFRHASEANQIEYWFDDDASTIQKKQFTEAYQNGTIYTIDLNNDMYPQGLHLLKIRVSTENGSKSAIYSTPVLVKSLYNRDPSEAKITGYSYSVDNGSATVHLVPREMRDKTIEDNLDMRNLSQGTHTLHAKVYNSFGGMTAIDHPFTISAQPEPKLTLEATADETGVRLTSNALANDIDYTLYRKKVNYPFVQIWGTKKSYPIALSHIDHPGAGNYVYYIEGNYTDRNGNKKYLKSSEVAVSVPTPQEEVFYGTLEGYLSRPGRPLWGNYDVYVEMNLGNGQDVRRSRRTGDYYSFSQVPEGAQVTLSVKGDNYATYEDKTFTVHYDTYFGNPYATQRVDFKGTLNEHAGEVSGTYDYALKLVSDLTWENNKIKFDVKSLHPNSFWNGSVYAYAIEKSIADKDNLDPSEIPGAYKSIRLDCDKGLSIEDGKNHAVSLSLEKIGKLRKDKDYYFIFFTNGSFTSDFYSSTKPLAMDDGVADDNGYVLHTLEKKDYGAEENIREDDASKLANLLVKLSCKVNGMDGHFGDLSSYYDVVREAAQSIGSTKEYEDFDKLVEYMGSTDVFELLDKPAFGPLCKAVDYASPMVSILHDRLIPYCKTAKGFTTALNVLKDIHHTVTGRDFYEKFFSCAHAIMYLGGKYTVGQMGAFCTDVGTYIDIGMSLAEAARQLGETYYERYAVSYWKENGEASNVNDHNAHMDFKIKIKKGNKTINFSKYSEQELRKMIDFAKVHFTTYKATGLVGTHDISTRLVGVKDGIMLKQTDIYSNGGTLDDNHSVGRMWMEIKWANGRTSLIPLMKSGEFGVNYEEISNRYTYTVNYKSESNELEHIADIIKLND